MVVVADDDMFAEVVAVVVVADDDMFAEVILGPVAPVAPVFPAAPVEPAVTQIFFHRLIA